MLYICISYEKKKLNHNNFYEKLFLKLFGFSII